MKLHPVIEAMRDARLARGWTVRDLARESGGAHENTIWAWEGGRSSPKVEQLAPVLAVLGLELTAEEPVLRLPVGRPHVRVEPPVRFGAAHIGGISCNAIADVVLTEGVEVAMDRHSLRREDVLVACWFQGRHGGRRWRFWFDWAQTAGGAMWAAKNGDYAAIPDPPDRPEFPATAKE